MALQTRSPVIYIAIYINTVSRYWPPRFRASLSISIAAVPTFSKKTALYAPPGGVRTHTIRDVPIFTHDLSSDELEERLAQFYDPYYATIDQVLQQIRATHGYALLLDAHTGSPRRMLDYQVIIGTRHGVTSHDAIGDAIDAFLPNTVLQCTTTLVVMPVAISFAHMASQKLRISTPFSSKSMPPFS